MVAGAFAGRASPAGAPGQVPPDCQEVQHIVRSYWVAVPLRHDGIALEIVWCYTIGDFCWRDARCRFLLVCVLVLR